MTSTDLYEYHEKEKFPSHKGAIAGLLVVFGGFIALGVYSLWDLWTVYDLGSIIESMVPFLAGNMWLIGVALGGIILMSVLLGLGASMAARRAFARTRAARGWPRRRHRTGRSWS